MKFNHASANISLILGIVLLVIVVPVTVFLVQQNQNLQNRAADSPGKSVPCFQLILAQKRYCQSTYPPSPSINNGVPCFQISTSISQYCL